ncbi:hypothetical protein GGR57DRAFT_52516 [Xylariaceae sp. FL1272]|nr:hypothetical protein GGR57DRAFT_52516 [Xylariaceae sp. FL1272]
MTYHHGPAGISALRRIQEVSLRQAITMLVVAALAQLTTSFSSVISRSVDQLTAQHLRYQFAGATTAIAVIFVGYAFASLPERISRGWVH